MNSFDNPSEKLFRAVWKYQVRKDGSIFPAAFMDRKGEGTSVQRQENPRTELLRETSECIRFMIEECNFKDYIVSVTVDNVSKCDAFCKEAYTENSPYHCKLYCNNRSMR